MRNVDPALQSHLDGRITTTCQAWILRLQGGNVTGFTDHDETLTIDGVTCEASTGFMGTEAASEFGLASDSQDIEGVLSADAISEDDLNAGVYDNAEVEIWLVNWANPEQRLHLRTSILGEVTTEDGAFRAELRGLTSKFEQRQGRTYSKFCDAVVGDARCSVILTASAYKTFGEVTEVVDRTTVRCAGLEGFEKNWFAAGQLLWTSGNNVGQSIELSSHGEAENDVLALWKSSERPVQIGDQFELTAGCDKRFSTCKSKFGNHENFRGFPHLPGADFALSYAKTGAVHDGRPLVK